MTTKLREQSSTPTPLLNSTSNGAKAALFNFVIYTKMARRVDYFREVIQNVVDKFPCRVIFILMNTREEKDYFETTIESLSAGGKTANIPCDQVTIEAGGQNASQIPHFILPYLIPDLPIYLLWGQDPTVEKELLPQVLPFAARLIFDSEATENLPQFSKEMLSLLRTTPCEMIDMNWARISGWRNVLLQIFDSEEAIEDLKNTETLTLYFNEIESSSFHHCTIQAQYLQGWLADRLEWTFQNFHCHENEIQITYQSKKGPIQVFIKGRKQPLIRPGSILAMKILTRSSTHYALTKIKKADSQVRVEITSPDHCEIPFFIHLSTINRGLNFIKELIYTPQSEHYERMLPLLQSCSKMKGITNDI